MVDKLDLLEMNKALLMLLFAGCGAVFTLWLLLTWWLLSGLPPVQWHILGGMMSLSAGIGVVLAACRP